MPWLLFVSLLFWDRGDKLRARSGLNNPVEPQAAKARVFTIAMAAVRKRRFWPSLAAACWALLLASGVFETRRAELETGNASVATSHRKPRARGAGEPRDHAEIAGEWELDEDA